jgi:hypothetical protein
MHEDTSITTSFAFLTLWSAALVRGVGRANRRDPKGRLGRWPGVRAGFEQCLAMLPETMALSARPQYVALSLRSKSLEQAYIESFFTEGSAEPMSLLKTTTFSKPLASKE